MKHLQALSVVSLVVAGSLIALASPAVAGPGPTIGGPSSVTLPVHGCYDLDEILKFKAPKAGRIVEWSATLRRSGISVPVGDNEVCGYMGTGTYTATVRIGWQEKRRVQRVVPVMKPNPALVVNADGWYEIKLPFRCSLSPQVPSMLPGYAGAYYSCQFDTPVPEYSVVQALLLRGDFDAQGMPGGVSYGYAYMQSTAPADATFIVSGPVGTAFPPSFTGTVQPDLSKYQADADVEVPLEVQVGTRKATVTEWSKMMRTRLVKSFRVNVSL